MILLLISHVMWGCGVPAAGGGGWLHVDDALIMRRRPRRSEDGGCTMMLYAIEKLALIIKGEIRRRTMIMIS
jgi:hypothetical protein